MAAWTSKAVSFSAGVGMALLAVSAPYLSQTMNIPLDLDLGPFRHFSIFKTPPSTHFQCLPQRYSTQIVSLDPLVIYIRDFLSPNDINGLLSAAEGLFKPSTVTRAGRTIQQTSRTSWSAGLPRDHPVVACVLDRANDFMGTMMAPGKDDIGPPQLVRYKPKQKFDVHRDWYASPQPCPEGGPRTWNRVASFFAILQANCTEGETHFPHIRPINPQDGADIEKIPWREHEKGGLAFKPVPGNAIFWVNLHANGTGDTRVEHAGLPVKDGVKTAMNIWPRRFFGEGGP